MCRVPRSDESHISIAVCRAVCRICKLYTDSFIEEEDWRVLQQQTGYGKSLLLASTDHAGRTRLVSAGSSRFPVNGNLTALSPRPSSATCLAATLSSGVHWPFSQLP